MLFVLAEFLFEDEMSNLLAWYNIILVKYAIVDFSFKHLKTFYETYKHKYD